MTIIFSKWIILKGIDDLVLMVIYFTRLYIFSTVSRLSGLCFLLFPI